ncbi:MAG: efflux RND transporter periplasmic adaptor subunit [Paramuribaculum sp.]|nr:efflux RND transporter periplasmic adaptor subunit [Paramuribaculum sp.]
MKRNPIIIGVALMGLWSLAACGSHSHSEHEHEHEGEEHEKEHAHGHDEIVVEPADAAKFGIETEAVELAPFNEVIAASGRIVASSDGEATITATAPGIVTLRSGLAVGEKIAAGRSIGSISSKNITGGDPNRAAKVAVDAAKREVDRLKPLLDEGIVTRGEYNAALAAYQSAQAAYSPAAAGGGLSSPITGVITQLLVQSGQFVEAGTPIATVSKGGSVMLVADLPEKYRNTLPSIRQAIFRPSYGEAWLSTDSLGGSRIESSATDAVAKAGYLPVVFSLRNDGTLSAGTFAEVNLITASSQPAIAVPTEALSEQQGTYFVYVKEGDHAYEKRKVEIGESDGQRTVIKAGLEPGESVVVKGTIMVKLAESSGAVPEGHSHNH